MLQTAVTAELPVASPSKTSALNRRKKMLGNFPTEVRAPTQYFRYSRTAKLFELQKETKNDITPQIGGTSGER